MVKAMTLEKLAVMVQRGFAETATKADLEALRSELRGEMNELGKELRKELASKQDLRELSEELVSELGNVSGVWSEKYHSLRQWVQDIDNRLMIIEGKPKRRAT